MESIVSPYLCLEKLDFNWIRLVASGSKDRLLAIRKVAVISGVTGQDGSYLAEFLLRLGYEVHGLARRNSSFNTSRVDHLHALDFPGEFVVHHADLHDPSSVIQLIATLKPDEFYNLAAQSHVRVSFELPLVTSEVTGIATLSILEGIRQFSPKTRFYQASSSEMFGSSPPPQSEVTNFAPRSPYGISKLYSYWIARNYREAYGLFVSNGILFNHESPRRTPTFITRKITRAAARLEAGIDERLVLGNLNARRDWGYAPEYVAGMWLLLQANSPQDLVLGTGTSTSVSEWLEFTFSLAGLGLDENVSTDPRYFRPTEVDDLVADSRLANSELGWMALTGPMQLAELMYRHDRELLSNPFAVDLVNSEMWDNLLA